MRIYRISIAFACMMALDSQGVFSFQNDHKWIDNKACKTVGKNTVNQGDDVDSKEECLSLCKAFDKSTVTASYYHELFCCQYHETQKSCKIVSSSYTSDNSDYNAFSSLYMYYYSSAKKAFPNLIPDTGGWLIYYKPGARFNDYQGDDSGAANYCPSALEEKKSNRAACEQKCFEAWEDEDCGLKDYKDRYHVCKFKDTPNSNNQDFCSLEWTDINDYQNRDLEENQGTENIFIWLDVFNQQECSVRYYPYENIIVYKQCDFGEIWYISKDRFKIKNSCYDHSSFSVIILDINGNEVSDHGLVIEDGRLNANIKVKFADATQSAYYEFRIGFKFNDKVIFQSIDTYQIEQKCTSCSQNQLNVNIPATQESYEFEQESSQNQRSIYFEPFTPKCQYLNCPISYSLVDTTNGDDLRLTDGTEAVWQSGMYCDSQPSASSPISLNDECVNDDSVEDADELTCSEWYDIFPEDCGQLDTNTFIAADLCCACKGQTSTREDCESKCRAYVQAQSSQTYLFCCDHDQTSYGCQILRGTTQNLVRQSTNSRVTTRLLATPSQSSAAFMRQRVTTTPQNKIQIDFPTNKVQTIKFKIQASNGGSIPKTVSQEISITIKGKITTTYTKPVTNIFTTANSLSEYQFNAFNCSFGCQVEYLILSEAFYQQLQVDPSKISQYDNRTDSVSGISLKQNTTGSVKLEVNTSSVMNYTFYVYGRSPSTNRQVNFPFPLLLLFFIFEFYPVFFTSVSLVFGILLSVFQFHFFVVLFFRIFHFLFSSSSSYTLNNISSKFTFQVQQFVKSEPPIFLNGIQDQHILFNHSESSMYTFPFVSYNLGQEKVTLKVSGLNESISRFDSDLKTIFWSNVVEPVNNTIEVTLVGLNNTETKYQVTFYITVAQQQIEEAPKEEEQKQESKETQETQKNEGINVKIEVVESKIEEKTEESKEPEEGFEINMQPIDSNGNLFVKFSEELKVPEIVETLQAQRSQRLLSEGDQNTFINVNETLDAFIKEVFEIKALKFHSESNSYIENKIAHSPHLVKWDERGIEIDLNFQNPLQVSRQVQQDKVVVRVIKEQVFESKERPGVIYKAASQNSNEAFTLQIPKQLPQGLSEQDVLDQVQNIKTSGMTLCIIQTICQMVMKGSQKKMINIYLSMQFISCLYIYSLSDPAIVEIVLKEMWDFVNFSKFKPANLWVFWVSVLKSTRSEYKFKTVYEEQTKVFEEQQSYLLELDYVSLVYAAFVIMVVGSVVLFAIQKTRQMIKTKIKKVKETMIWNGLIAFVDTCLVTYCLKFSYVAQSLFKEEQGLTKRIQLIVEITVYSIIVFVSQILILGKLKGISNTELKSKESQKLFGYLTRDVQLREDLKLSKYFFSLSLALRSVVVFTPILIANNQLLQLAIANLAIYINLVITQQITAYSGSRLEARLRNSVDYLISICFILPVFSIGRFVETDDGTMCWEGYLSDENLQSQFGFVQVSCFGLVFFMGFLNLLVPFLVVFRKIGKFIQNFRAVTNSQYREQNKSKSTELFNLMQYRMDQQKDKLSEYKEFCREYSKPMSNQEFLIRFGHLPLQDQNFVRNEYKMSQLKFAQLGIVLDSKMAFMSTQEVEKLKQHHELKMNAMKDKQSQLKKVIQNDLVIQDKDSEIKFLDLSVYEAMDLVQKYMLTQKQRKILIEQGKFLKPDPTDPRLILSPSKETSTVRKQQNVNLKSSKTTQKANGKEKVLPDNHLSIEDQDQTRWLDSQQEDIISPACDNPNQVEVQQDSLKLEISNKQEDPVKPNKLRLHQNRETQGPQYRQLCLPEIAEEFEDPLASVMDRQIPFQYDKHWAKSVVTQYIKNYLVFDKSNSAEDYKRILDQLPFGEANKIIESEFCKEMNISVEQILQWDNFAFRQHYLKKLKFDEKEYEDFLVWEFVFQDQK